MFYICFIFKHTFNCSCRKVSVCWYRVRYLASCGEEMKLNHGLVFLLFLFYKISSQKKIHMLLLSLSLKIHISNCMGNNLNSTEKY